MYEERGGASQTGTVSWALIYLPVSHIFNWRGMTRILTKCPVW